MYSAGNCLGVHSGTSKYLDISAVALGEEQENIIQLEIPVVATTYLNVEQLGNIFHHPPKDFLCRVYNRYYVLYSTLLTTHKTFYCLAGLSQPIEHDITSNST